MGETAVNTQPLAFQWARQSTGVAQANSLTADSLGNAYVAGGFEEEKVSFGGITMTNLGIGDAFLAKYDVAGNPIWARQGGVIVGGKASIIDTALDVSGNTYAVGYFRGELNFGGSNTISVSIDSAQYGSFVAKFSSSGSLVWLRQIGFGTNASFASEVAVDGAGNTYVAGQFDGVLVFDSTLLTSVRVVDNFLAKYDTDGGIVWVRQAGGGSYDYPTALAVDTAGNCYVAGNFRQTISFGATNLASTDASSLFMAKYSATGEVEWAQKAGGPDFSEIQSAAADAFGNFYLAGYYSSNITFGATNVTSQGRQDGFVAKFSGNGSLRWIQSSGESNQYCFLKDVTVNPIGSVFVSGYFKASVFFGTNRLVSAGDSDAFFAKYSNDGVLQSLGRIGEERYDDGCCIAAYGNNNFYAAGFFTLYARIGNTFLTGEPGSMFLSKIVPVGNPKIIVDGSLAFGGSEFARGAASIVLATDFAGGTILYSLDGSDPAEGGFLYSSPFMVRGNAMLRVVAYNSDYSQSYECDPVDVVIRPQFTATTAGGGSVTIDPPRGDYFSNSTATVTATLAPGWSFLQWLGAANGTNPTATVGVTQDSCVEAVFGTSLQTNIVGSGSIQLSADMPLYPFGATVKLTAVPKAGSYFAQWGTAASGTNNPLNFTVTGANPTITAVFAALAAGQRSLTVIESGRGQVTRTPSGNRFGNGTNITLLAVPDAGQEFIGWSGDLSGITNPQIVTMTTNKTITALFTRRPALRVQPCMEGMTADGFRVRLTGDYGLAYQIESSSNLFQWHPLATVTNVLGVVDFTDSSATNYSSRYYRAN